jgi:hypothetical protein
MKNRCKTQMKDQKQCRSFARTGSEFCFFHDPQTEEQRKAAAAAGGRASRSAVHSEATSFSLRTRFDIRKQNEFLANMLWADGIDHLSANSATQLGNILLRALKLKEEEDSICELEVLGSLDLQPESSPEPETDRNNEPETDRNNEPTAEDPAIRLSTIGEIIDLLENTANLVIGRTMDTHTANCIGCVANSQLRLISTELAERKARLEAFDENRRVRR